MKKPDTILLAIVCLAMASEAAWGQKTWTGGGGDGQWGTASNWSGGTVPTSSDQVLLDNTTVSGSYTVTLPTGATSTTFVRLTITPSTGNTITLVLPSGNTSTQGLFVGDNTSNTDDIILNDGAILKNSSGAASGTPVTVNSTTNGTFRINSGGKYLHNNIRGGTTGLADRLSTASGTERGIFEFDVPGTASFSPSGSGRTYGMLVLTRSGGAATYSVSGGSALTVKSDFIMNSGVTFSSTMTGALNIGGDLTNNGAALSLPSGQAVVFNGSGTQTISGTGSITFGEGATVNNSSTVVLGRSIAVSTTKTFTVNGTLNCGANAVTGAGNFTLSSGGTLGIGSVDGITSSGASGNIQVSGTRSFNTAANYTYNGSSAQVTGDQLPSTVSNLTVNNNSGLTLTNSLTVNGTHTFTSGNISTGANTLAISSTGSVSRTSGHVVGHFKKNVAAGATSRTFEIGDASNYTPVSVTFGNVTVTGDLTAKTTAGDHPNIATSGIDANKSVNRYWTLTNSGITFDSYSGTFNFVAGDVDNGANSNNFAVKKYDGTSWSTPTTGTKTATSTQITGGTSFSDFAVGELTLVPTITLTGSLNDFGTVTVGSTSSEQSYSVSGSNLSDNIVITAPQHFQVSTTSGSGFGSSITLTQSGGTVNTTTIYARFAPTTTGVKSGNISHTSSGATTQNVAVSGTGTTAPTITVTGTLNNFGTIVAGSVSSEQSYTVSGANLSANITVTAPTGFEVSTTSGSGFGSSVTLTQSGGNVASTTIYVRFAPATPALFSANITHASTGTTTQNLAVAGTALALKPTVQSSAILFSSVGGTSMTLTWTNGNGANRLVVGRLGGAVNADPVDGTSYTANAALGSGSQIGTGNYVIFAGAGNSVTVTGLGGNSTYHFAVYELNGSGGTENYLTTSAALGSQITGTASYAWSASGTSSWISASSWTPVRNTPSSTDVVTFNGGGSVTVTNVPAQTLAQLSVTNNTTVNLQAGGANTLTINGGVNAFSVASGSQLNTDGTNALTISLPTGTTGSVAGSMTFSNAAHKLLAADATGVTFQSGATFVAGSSLSGNPFGTTNNSSIVFANGSTYIFISGSNPFGATAPGSAVVFQTGSLFSHQSPSGSPSLSGRTYANFEFNAAGATVSATGSSALTMDNLTVTDGTLNLNLTGAINIKGNISAASGKTLTFTPASSAALNLNGTGTQTLSGSGTLTFSSNCNVSVGSSSTVVLNRDITVNGSTSVSGTLNCGTNVVSGAGSFTLQSGASLITGSAGGITASASAGSVQVVGSRTYSPSANYTCDGSSAQVTGDGLPSSVNNLTINNSSGAILSQDVVVTGTLTLTSGSFSIGAKTLTISGGLTITGGSLQGGGSSNLSFTGSGLSLTLPALTLGQLTVNRANGISLGGAVSVNNLLTLSSGAISNAGNLTIADLAAILRSGGSLSGSPTFSGLVDLTYTSTLATSSELPASASALRDLTIAAGLGNTVTLAANTTVNGSLVLTSGTLTLGSNTIDLKSAVTGSGTLQPGTGTVSYTQAADGQNIAALHYYNLTFGNSKKTLPSSGTVGIAGTFTPGSATGHTVSGSTINFNGASQTIPGFTYHHLTLSGSGTKIAATGVTVNGTLTISSVTLADGGNTVVAKGNVVQNGSHSGVGKIQLSGGPAAHTIAGGGAFQNLEIDDVQGATLTSGDITINGTLTLTNGTITTGANKLIVGATGTIANGNTMSYVIGNLRKSFATGNQSFRFAIGDATKFTPVNISSINITAPGSLSVTTTASRHVEIIGSGINAAKGMGRFWTISSSGGLTFSTYDATFEFPASDVDAGADPTSFIVRRFLADNWFGSTVGTRTATSTQITGEAGLGDFAIGEVAGPDAPVALVRVSDQALLGKITVKLEKPLVVRINDALGNPVQGVTVKFALSSIPTGSTGHALSATTVLTDTNGRASTQVTPGTKIGTYTVTATSIGMRGSPIIFQANAISLNPSSMTLTSGDKQTGTVGSKLAQLLIVQLKDQFNNTVEGSTVNFAITAFPAGATGQSLSVSSATSADDGFATTSLTLGDNAGTYQVTTTSPDLPDVKVVISATATFGTAAKLVATSGSDQSGPIKTALPNPFVVTITDNAGNSISGVAVAFTITGVPSGAAGQSLSVVSATSDAAGRASTVLTMGSRAGSYTVTATSSAIAGASVTFTASAFGGAESISLTSGNNQIASVRQALPQPMVVFVADGAGNAVQGIPVTFAIASFPPGATGQILSVTSATTGSSGQASSVLTLGDREGVFAITATSEALAGSPVLFLAVALSVTSVERVDVLPTDFQLFQNYPNPFNPSTEIQFDLKQGGIVKLQVQDVVGRISEVLVDGVAMPAGRYRTRWNAANKPSGVYLLRIAVQPDGGQVPYVATRKVVLLK